MKKYTPDAVQSKWRCSTCGRTHIEPVANINKNGFPLCEECGTYKNLVEILVPEEPIKPGE